MMTAIDAILPNCSDAVGDIVAKTCKVIIPATTANPKDGTLRRLILANRLLNNPSSAAALAVCPTNNVQPPSEPRQPKAAQSATIFPAVGPRATFTASENGAEEAISSWLGIIPIIADELST